MLYLLGGAARAGKSTIARQFLVETGIPFFCLDYLMMGFAKGLPEHGVDPDDDELHVADLLWPVIEAMATALVENEEAYLFEGVQLRPQHAHALNQKFPGQIQACFIGYAEADVQAKFEEIRRFGGGADDWLKEITDQEVLANVARLKALSRHLRDECHRYGLKYIEVSADLAQTVSETVRYLRSSQK